MAATLIQSDDASFPDRPSHNTGTGLRVTLSENTNGSYLEYQPDSAPDPLHVRVMIAPDQVSDGHVTFMDGLDNTDAETFHITFDADLNQIQFTVDSTTLTATRPTALAWHAIEITIDHTAGTVALDINGVNLASQSSISVNPTTTLRLGCLGKHNDTTGTLDLDEWLIADQAIGTVSITPTTPYANDPAAWLVVYNTQSSDSITWAEYYRQARGIPYANLCGLNLPTTETINASAFASLTQQIQTYLQNNNLENTVLGILMGYNVPGYANITGIGPIESIPALLHTTSTVAGTTANPIDASTTIIRPTADLLNGKRLTARLDAPTLADAIAMIDRAVALEATDLTNASGASEVTLWLDPYTTASELTTPHINAMTNWSQSLSAQQLRIPIEVTEATDSEPNPDFAQISHDGFYWGWSNASPPAGFFASTTGQRIFAFDLHTLDTTAPTLRDWSTGRWVGAAFTAGYAAAAGTSRNYSLSSLPQATIFFAAMRSDLTLAESFFLACPILRDGLFIVGDPLTTISLPRAGWDVFGPVDTLESLDFSTPAASLPIHQTTWPNQTTAEHETRFVALRKRDTFGRTETGINITRFAATEIDDSTIAVSPPMDPIWPDLDHENWSPVYINQTLTAQIIWDRPLGLAQIATVELWTQVDELPASLAQTLITDPQSRIVSATIPAPESSTRYQFRATSDDGIIITTPWSAPVTPTSPDAGHDPLTIYSPIAS